MITDSVDDLGAAGFSGFKSMRDLFCDHATIPKQKGVYLILRPATATDPEFIHPGTGGHFKGKDPNVTAEILTANWVKGSLIVYIGKAGGTGSGATLHSRLKQYFNFGQGKPVGHLGGRYIWQLKDSADLVVCWKSLPDDEPGVVESGLIGRFVEKYGRRPFANLRD